ncbi:MAG TPA: molybdopterin converting factor subunit 1 [Gammaproteobacteria bacterium]|nr:molybdopterin converting factor subunit 1 [Gammaproteobacteria bacterium]
MRVQVRFFAALRERAGTPALEVKVPAGATVAEVWSAATPEESFADNVLAAKNMQYVGFDSPVEEGDEIAFFPPVTGGAG